MKNNLKFGNKLTYAIGGLGYSSMSQTLNSFIMFFATAVMGISGSLVGIAIAISSLWDGVSDPLIGHLSDNCRNKFFGKRLGFMLFGIFLISFINILIWSMPMSLPEWLKFVWLLVGMLAIESANTCFGTPYSALAIDIAPDYNDQSKVQGFKTVFNIIGMILPNILMYFFMPSISIGIQSVHTQQGYIKIALINSSLLITLGLITIFGTLKYVRKNNIYHYSKEKEKFQFSKLLGGYFNVLKNKDFRSVIIGYSCATIASSFLTGVGLHLFTYCYHFSSPQISMVLIAMFGGAIASQPLWVYLSKRIDKKKSLIISLSTIILGVFIIAVTFLFREFISVGIMFYLALPCMLFCGIGAGAMYCLPFSMYADVVTLEMVKTGNSNAGAYTGYFTFSCNLANSIALLIIGFLLDLIKFDSSQPVQALSVQNGLGMIVFLGCIIFMSLAIMAFSYYSVKRSQVLKIQMRIDRDKNSKVAHNN
ncbi:MAG: MFS transporter [Clostridia bacterium]|nr:MFS transporter [Clostridia bacterium]